MNFSLIIPNYNGQEILTSCLKSLNLAIKNCPNSKFEIIIVDNGSINPHPDTTIFLPKNMGFGYAINRGVSKSKYEYIVILNNDIILNKNWFKNIVQAIKENPNYACYYGLVLNKDGTKIESTGLKFYKSGKAINNKTILQKAPYKIWGCPASLVIYKKEIFNKLNGFDEKYFAYIEDVDLAYQLNKNNYSTLFVPSAISHHIGGATSSKIKYFREYMTVKNWWIFILKNYSKTKIIKNFFPIIIERLRNLKALLVKLLKL